MHIRCAHCSSGERIHPTSTAADITVVLYFLQALWSQDYAITTSWQRCSALRDPHWFPLSPQTTCTLGKSDTEDVQKPGVQILSKPVQVTSVSPAQSRTCPGSHRTCLRPGAHTRQTDMRPHKDTRNTKSVAVLNLHCLFASSLSLRSEIFFLCPSSTSFSLSLLLSQAQETKRRMQTRGENKKNKKNEAKSNIKTDSNEWRWQADLVGRTVSIC